MRLFSIFFIFCAAYILSPQIAVAEHDNAPHEWDDREEDGEDGDEEEGAPPNEET